VRKSENQFGPNREVELEVQQHGPHEVRFTVVEAIDADTQVANDVSSPTPQIVELAPGDAGRTFQAAPDATIFQRYLGGGR
jgi:hypothetical protein